MQQINLFKYSATLTFNELHSLVGEEDYKNYLKTTKSYNKYENPFYELAIRNIGEEYKYYYTNYNSQQVSDYFELATSFSGEYAAVKKDGKFYFINRKLEQASEFFQNINPFFGDHALVQKDDKWYFINRKFKIVSEAYDEAVSFCGPYAAVKKDGEYFFIDRSFKRLDKYKDYKIINISSKGLDVTTEFYAQDELEIPENIINAQIIGNYTYFDLGNKNIIVEEEDYKKYLDNLELIQEKIMEELKNDNIQNAAEINSITRKLN